MAPKRATRTTPVVENPTTTTVTNAQLQAMIDQGVTAALAARDANRNGDDIHTLETGARRTERVARECTYQDFMKCQPLYFKGTEGVFELTQWFERMETVFRISNCSMENKIKFSTYLRKKMTDKYCPRNEMKKLEAELWNLKVKGTDVTGYNQRFQELALLCVRMFPEESDKVERYVGGLPDMIHGSVVASKPKTMQEATEMATELMDKKISTFAERQAETRGNLTTTTKLNTTSQEAEKGSQAYPDGTGEQRSMLENSTLSNSARLPRKKKNALANGRKLNPGKLDHRGDGKVGSVAYKLELPQELSRVHNTFYVSNLEKCHADEPLAVPLDGLYLDDKLHFVEERL
ncbi:reverse transcriptase domain-containing protein [Tanacetum coccineum]